MKIWQFTRKFLYRFFFLLIFFLFGTVYFCAEPSMIMAPFTHTGFANVSVAKAQTIPTVATPPIVDLSELDFRVAVEATVVAPGEIIRFNLQVTNTTAFTLDPIALVTAPPNNTSFSVAASSDAWLQSGTQSTPCADGHPAGFSCFFLLDRLMAGETFETTFAVKIDPDLPIGGEQISLLANIYPADQQPLAPNPPPPIDGQDSPNPDPADTQYYTFLPLL